MQGPLLNRAELRSHSQERPPGCQQTGPFPPPPAGSLTPVYITYPPPVTGAVSAPLPLSVRVPGALSDRNFHCV